MTQFVNAVVDRPITDARHFSSIVRADPAVRHMWTLIQDKAYRDPVSNAWKMPARKGEVPMTAVGPTVSWAPRGGYSAAHFDDAVADEYTAEIDNPGNLFSILMNCRAPVIGGVALSVEWPAGALTVGFMPRRTDTLSGLRINTNAGGTGVAPASAEWAAITIVINLNAGQVISKSGARPWNTYVNAALIPQASGKVSVILGRHGLTGIIPFIDGSISDVAIVAGDVRDMPALTAAWDAYNTTAYGA